MDTILYIIALGVMYGAGYVHGHPTITWRGTWDRITGWFTRERF